MDGPGREAAAADALGVLGTNLPPSIRQAKIKRNDHRLHASISKFFWEDRMELTAVFVKVPEGGYAAFVEELPGANTQGSTLEEARANLREAASLIIEANREIAEKSLQGQAATREPLELTS
jgi:predicted RNase H-like HicB family nuclease